MVMLTMQHTTRVQFEMPPFQILNPDGQQNARAREGESLIVVLAFKIPIDKTRLDGRGIRSIMLECLSIPHHPAAS